MPRKNSKARTTTASRVLHAVPDPAAVPGGRTAEEDRVWAALHAHPGRTSAELAVLAGIGRSTAGKILAAWALEDSVARTAGPARNGRRGADTWTIADTTVEGAAEPPATQPTCEAAGTEPSAVTDVPGEGEAEKNGAMDPAGAARPFDATASGPAGPGRRGGRLGKGALRGMVEDYLAEHPGEQLGPTAIGKALGRSSGAVSNALAKLVADGYAVQVRDKPKRFAVKPPTDGPTG